MRNLEEIRRATVDATIDELKDKKKAFYIADHSDKEIVLEAYEVRAYRENREVNTVEIIDIHGNFYMCNYLIGLGVVIEDSLPKPEEGPGEGWTILRW